MNELPSDRPLLQAALLCERILFEQDNTLSAIRIVDKFNVPKDTPDGVPIMVQLLVCFKSGNYEGSFPVTFRLRRPSGLASDAPIDPLQATFRGKGNDGTNLMVTMGVVPSEMGLHYFEVRTGDAVLAYVPFTLERTPEPAEGQPATSPK